MGEGVGTGVGCGGRGVQLGGLEGACGGLGDGFGFGAGEGEPAGLGGCWRGWFPQAYLKVSWP